MNTREPARLAALLLTIIAISPTAIAQDAPGSEKSPVPIDESALTDDERARIAVIRLYLERHREGEFEAAAGMFIEEVRRQVDGAFLEKWWKEIREAKGEYESQMITSADTEGDRFEANLLVSFETNDLEFEFRVNAAHEIVQAEYFLDAAPEYVDLTIEFTELLEKEEYEEVIDMCDDVMKGILTPESLARSSVGFAATYGEFLGFGDFRHVPIPGYYSVFVEWKFERGEILLNLTYNAQKQVMALGLFPKSQVDLEKAAEEAKAAQE